MAAYDAIVIGTGQAGPPAEQMLGSVAGNTLPSKCKNFLTLR
jgi:hypothetical protein